MITTILRHGEAGIAAKDSERELTPAGLDDISFGSHQFRDACDIRGIPAPALILHSAWQRTSQTADILAALFPRADVATEASLLPNGRVTGVTDTLLRLQQQRPDLSHVVLVSHQPLVSELADYYLGFPNSVPPLPPGGLLCMDFEIPGRDCGRLLFWALPPEYEAGL